MQDSVRCSVGGLPTLVVTEVDDYSAPTDGLYFFRSTLPTGNLSLCDQEERVVRLGNRKGTITFFMTALVDLGGRFEQRFWFQQLAQRRFHSQAQAFGREPNALPKLCNCLIQKSFGSPG